MSDPVSASPLTPNRGVLGRVLEPILQLWLRSQVDSVEKLSVHLEGSDRQLLSGHLPSLQLESEQVLYQGLHLSRVKLWGRHIRLNSGQLLKGKPLELLEPIPVELDITLTALDAQQSLHSDLFQTAILEALQQIVGEQMMEALGQSVPVQSLKLYEPRLILSAHKLRLNAHIQHSPSQRTVPLALQTGLRLPNPHTLVLHQPEWFPTPHSQRGLPLDDLDGHPFHLGSEVRLETLTISESHIGVRGILLIVPS